MANFSKSAQNILGAISAGSALVSGVQGLLGSRRITPDADQQLYNGIREHVLADIRKWGIQKTNLGYVLMDVPTTLRNISNTQEVLFLAQRRADQFPIPGVQIATSELRRYGVGPFEKKPYLPTFADINIDFIGDSQGNIHKYFYMWLNSMVNFFEVPAENAKKDKFGNSSKNPFALEYKDNYKTRITILTFDENQKKMCEIYLHNAFPVSVGEIQYNWSDENQLVRFPVSFNYTHWTYNIDSENFGFSAPQVETSRAGFDFVYNFLIQLYPAAQALELATRRPQQIQDVLNIVNAGKTGLSPITRYF